MMLIATPLRPALSAVQPRVKLWDTASQRAFAASAAQPTSPTLHIVAQSGRLAGSRYRLTDRIAIGRDPSRCHIVFPADTPGVSGLHCELFVQNGAVYLRDCNSSYGTYLANGTKLAGGNIVMVGVGTTFFVGERDNSFTVQY